MTDVFPQTPEMSFNALLFVQYDPDYLGGG